MCGNDTARAADFPSFLSFPIADWLTLARKWSSSSGTINANRSSFAVEAPELENIAAAEEREREGGRGEEGVFD